MAAPPPSIPEFTDVAVVGGGIVGLATARALLQRRPGLRLVVLEKEPQLAAHQTGHNSGVIHAGLYYKPGSAKARLCVAGVALMHAFCAAHGIRTERCGKLIVATRADELPRLQALYERGQHNGVPGLALIDDPGRLRAIEPHAAALRALHSPHTAIVDYREVAQALAHDLAAAGATVATSAAVTAVAARPDGLRLGVTTTAGAGAEVVCRLLVNCAGLYADRLARLAGASDAVRDLQIVPFRGEYYMLKPARRDLVRGLIYPVPDPALPFLGVHLTRTVHGEIEAGPNAVLAFAREGYRLRDVDPRELLATLAFPGFRAMARRHLRTGAYELYRSLHKAAFVRDLQRLLPALRDDDLERGGAGVRAQAVRRDGTLVDDFHIVGTARAIHVLNAPSPAATASLAIGQHIAELATAALG